MEGWRGELLHCTTVCPQIKHLERMSSEFREVRLCT